MISQYSSRTLGALSLSLALHALLLWRVPLPEVAGGPNPVEQVAIRLAMLTPAADQSAAQSRTAKPRQASASAAESSAQPKPAQTGQKPLETWTNASSPEPMPQQPAAKLPESEPAPATKTEAQTALRDSTQTQTRKHASNAASAPASPAEASDREIVIRKPRFRVPPQPPAYPLVARRRGQSGRVLVRARLDTRGDVTEIKIMDSSGYEALDKAALTAVEDWKFEPYRRGGQALIAWVELPVVFELR